MTRPARARRARRLWSAAWLAAFLVVGLLLVGELPGEWAVLVVPLLWALPALRRPRDDVRPATWTAPPSSEPLVAWDDDPEPDPRPRAGERLRPPRDWAGDGSS